ncbi:ROK family protein [Actinosynnema sp. NPDC004786]
MLGHFPVDPVGPICPEGHRGCVKALLTTDGIQSQAALTLGRPVTYDEVLDLAEEGNAVADQIVGRAAHAFGTLIAAVANIAQPERIILTGEGIRLAQVAEARVRATIAQSRHAEASPIDLRFINDDPTLWARGAAAVAIQRTVLAVLPLRAG